jgi:hypothetical protein
MNWDQIQDIATMIALAELVLMAAIVIGYTATR